MQVLPLAFCSKSWKLPEMLALVLRNLFSFRNKHQIFLLKKKKWSNLFPRILSFLLFLYKKERKKKYNNFTFLQRTILEIGNWLLSHFYYWDWKHHLISNILLYEMNMNCFRKENMVGFCDHSLLFLKSIFVFRLNVSLEQKLHPSCQSLILLIAGKLKQQW